MVRPWLKKESGPELEDWEVMTETEGHVGTLRFEKSGRGACAGSDWASSEALLYPTRRSEGQDETRGPWATWQEGTLPVFAYARRYGRNE